MPNACSYRNGDAGYHNLKYFSVSYDSLEDHIRDLKTSIMQKHIREPREYYTQVRVKPKNQKFSIDELQKEGIHYLEIRSLDLMPTQASGIKKDFLDFLHLFLVYGLVSDDTNDLELDYPLAFQNQLIVANSGLHPNTEISPGPEVKKKVQTFAQDILASMKKCFEAMGLDKESLKPIEQTKNSFSEINLLIEGVKQQGYTAYFLGLAKKYHEESLERRFQLRHYEDLELSTQVLLKETIKQGIHFYFLDRQDNFLELYNDHLRQWVKQATKTKLDHYASVLAMENKLVTKTLLARAGIHVAYGESYIKPEAAVNVYSHFSDSDIVIKPNQTNFGIGITILKTPYSEKEFAQAIHFAFQFDQRILIEHFFPGKEYRFLVIHDEVVAVLHREAANVIGNGQDSIQELVRQKNLHPMRGEGYRKPLEKIKLEEIEQQFLKKQQLNINSILAKDEKIYLRENSNISTGGDSLDFTDSIPDVYKNIAIKATQSVDAVICGVDMMIRDIYQHHPKGNYCLIELNFNPAIHIHTFPFIGKDRKVAQKILQTLKLIPH